MSSATQLGISEKEYEEALAVEKLFFLSSRERCNYCNSGKSTFVDTYDYEFLCDRCAYKSKHKKKIGEDSISYYDVQKLEKKFGGSGSKHNKYHRKLSHNYEKKSRSKSKSRHSSKKHIEVTSDSSISEYEKIKKEKKKKKEKEKHKNRNKEKSKRKKTTEETDDGFDAFSLNDYENSTPGMIGIMNSNNINPTYKKNFDNFNGYDTHHLNFKKMSNQNFNDFGIDNNVNQVQFDQFQKNNFNSKFMNTPNSQQLNSNPIYFDDLNTIYHNKVNFPNNFNMELNEENELKNMQYNKISLHPYDPFNNNNDNHYNTMDNINYFNNSNLFNNSILPSNQKVMNNLYTLNKRNKADNQFVVNNSNSIYKHNLLKNPYALNSQNNIDSKNNFDKNMNYNKNLIFQNYKNYSHLLKNNLDKANNNQLTSNNINSLDFFKQTNFSELKRNYQDIYNTDFSPVTVSDKNPFSLQNLIPNVNFKKSNNFLNSVPSNFNNFNMNRNLYKPMSYPIFESNRRF